MNDEIARLAHEHGLERVAERIAGAVEPAIQLLKTGAAGPAAGTTRLGGLPDVPPGFAWPRWKNRPLGFLGQLRCEEIAAADVSGLLPRAGLLSFFYDLVEQPWGFDPTQKGFASVLYTEDTAALTRATMPAGAKVDTLPGFAVRPRSVQTLPALQSAAFDGLGIGKDEWDAYSRLYDAADERVTSGGPRHQVLGHSWNVQGDMQLECQLVTHGLYCGDEAAWKSPRRAELEPGAAEWRLLLQIDTDDDFRTMWGDGGLVYYWLREPDLRSRRFGESWTILQCF